MLCNHCKRAPKIIQINYLKKSSKLHMHPLHHWYEPSLLFSFSNRNNWTSNFHQIVLHRLWRHVLLFSAVSIVSLASYCSPFWWLARKIISYVFDGASSGVHWVNQYSHSINTQYCVYKTKKNPQIHPRNQRRVEIGSNRPLLQHSLCIMQTKTILVRYCFLERNLNTESAPGCPTRGMLSLVKLSHL